eukprot:gene8985-16121_t
MSSFYSTSNASSEGGRASPLATQCGLTLPNEEPMQLQKSLSTSSFASLEYSKPVSALSRSLAPDSNLRLSVLPRTFSASPCISETASGLDTSRSSVDTPDCLPRPTSSSAECYSGRAGSIPIDVPNTCYYKTKSQKNALAELLRVRVMYRQLSSDQKEKLVQAHREAHGQ